MCERREEKEDDVRQGDWQGIWSGQSMATVRLKTDQLRFVPALPDLFTLNLAYELHLTNKIILHACFTFWITLVVNNTERLYFII